MRRKRHFCVMLALISLAGGCEKKEPATLDALCQAARAGDVKRVRQLIAGGVEVNVKVDADLAPLHYAAMYGQKDVVELLLAKGAEIHAMTRPLWPAPSPDRETEGIDRRSLPVKPTGARASDSSNDFTPLHYALMGGYKDVAELLVAQGAKVDVNVKYQDDWTLLHVAAWHGQRQAVEMLLAHGAEVNAKTSDGQTPMDVALDLGHRELVQFLSSAGGEFGIRKNVGTQ